MTQKKKRILVIAGICFAVYFIAIFFVASAVLTRMAPEKLAEFLGRPVAVEKIRANPLTLSVTVYGLEIKDKNKTDPFVRFEKLYVNAEAWSLIRRGLVLKRVLLEKPEIHVARLSGATFNFSDLLAGEKEEENPAEEKSPAEPFGFAVANISVVDGTVVYRDLPFGKTHTISPINWQVPFISNFIRHRNRKLEPALTLSVDGATLSVDVQTKPFKNSMETVVDMALSGVSIPRYTAYMPKDRIGFQVEQGDVDITTQISFYKENDRSVVTVQGQAAIVDLDVKDREGDGLFTLPRLAVTVLPSVVTESRLHVGEVQVQSPILSVIRQADGVINLAGLVISGEAAATADENTLLAETETVAETEEDGQASPQADVAESEQASETVPPGQPAEAAEPDPPAVADAPEEDTSEPFVVDVDRFVLTGGTARFVDFAVAGPEDGPVENAISDLNVTVAPFTTAPEKESRFDVSALINGAAPLNVSGQMVLTPLSVESDVRLSDVALAWGQPYLPDNVRLVINDGRAAVSGHLSLAAAKEGQISATVTGEAGVKDFATSDPEKGESFLRWSDFTLDGIKVSTPPLRVNVDSIAFTDLAQQVVVFEDGATNIARIFISPETPAEPADHAPEAAEPKDTGASVTPIQIGRFLMNNTELKFADRSVDPHYATRLTLTDLKVTGLTSEDFKAADVMAKGTIDGYAPVRITGAINPLGTDLFMDLDVKLSNMEMVPLSAYTGKYIGRAIEKGKMDLDLQYDIQQKVLSADNHILLDQFTLGNTVESPEAMNLPVGLAVALLKDRKGVIDVNLPVSGRIDDPEFRVGRIVFKALANLITKAATSPFALVGSLVGGGEEMRFIEFEPGWAELDELGRQKLDGVKKLLVERPALKLEILGYADPDADRRALAAIALERTIKAPALEKLGQKGESPDSETLATAILPAGQYDRTLRRIYEKEVEEKPIEGVVVKKADDPTLSIEEMETAIVERRAGAVTDAELGLLAKQRAEKVKDYLLSDETLSPERVFMKAPGNIFKTADGEFAASRVELGVQ
ncbi:DUF748 domain-containing protein [Desulfosudis oleivorans]|uniref:DUF748 domain-containing protein n=1 Tax=Desulfosudis oleivorans (strain DSM 6200 / JCM 39069 / Hxd3) TaxID=96561 RepID=A8ZWF7_DESOH|nr:DUF748 domain-containing protein [Desulfosudis oleivorans]ABW66765.1 protein of unknown function DUF748 [Desulfosudis oleivorans Hxd3]